MKEIIYIQEMERMIKMNKFDFIATVVVNNANPNGDPLAGNMPRTDSRGYGEMSDVSIKRKIRNRMQNLDKDIFVQSRDRTEDGYSSLQERFEAYFKELNIDIKQESETVIVEKMCQKWLDIRTFGQVIAFGKKFTSGIRGPVSISIAKSLDPVSINSMQITRSTNGVAAKGSARSSDTMGTKHFVEFGVYVITGSINSYFSEKTGFSEDDVETIKECLRTLFVNDTSSARPEGSMEIKDIFWFEHSNKIGNVSTAKIKDLLLYNNDETIKESYKDYNIHLNEEALNRYVEEGLKYTKIEGI